MTTNDATLLVSCPDRTGIVAALAQLLYGHGANILDCDQHVDRHAGYFFERIRFDLESLHTDKVTLEKGIAEVAQRFDLDWQLVYGGERKRVVIFVSKYDHCLYDLLVRHQAGELNCEIPLIVSNHEDLAAVAQQFNVPFRVFPITKETKQQQEAAELALLHDEKIDLVVLARYMQILSPEFCESFSGRTINIHHSFLPAFVGKKPYHQAHARGVKQIGATAHYVTGDLDQGPIIEQDAIRVSHRDAIKDLIRKGRDIEKTVLARAVRWHLEDRLLTYRNKTVVFD